VASIDASEADCGQAENHSFVEASGVKESANANPKKRVTSRHAEEVPSTYEFVRIVAQVKTGRFLRVSMVPFNDSSMAISASAAATSSDAIGCIIAAGNKNARC
jgi:hypothetical protein